MLFLAIFIMKEASNRFFFLTIIKSCSASKMVVEKWSQIWAISKNVASSTQYWQVAVLTNADSCRVFGSYMFSVDKHRQLPTVRVAMYQCKCIFIKTSNSGVSNWKYYYRGRVIWFWESLFFCFEMQLLFLFVYFITKHFS